MTHGHCKADVDPLELDAVYAGQVASKFHMHNENLRDLLSYETYGFTDADLDKTFYVHFPQWGGILSQKEHWTLREIRDAMEQAYCGKIGVEYMHIPDRDQCNWLRDRVELQHAQDLTVDEKRLLLDRVFWTDEFA